MGLLTVTQNERHSVFICIKKEKNWNFLKCICKLLTAKQLSKVTRHTTCKTTGRKLVKGKSFLCLARSSFQDEICNLNPYILLAALFAAGLNTSYAKSGNSTLLRFLSLVIALNNVHFFTQFFTKLNVKN